MTAQNSPTTAGTFDWSRTSQLSIPVLLAASFGPSAVAFSAFHGILPRVVAADTHVLIAWPAVASGALAGFVAFAVFLLYWDAKQVGVTLRQRLCVGWPSDGEWVLSICVFGLAGVLALVGGGLMAPLMAAVGFEVPAYMPFFLNPAINPLVAKMSVISPGMSLAGRFDLLPLITIALVLNLLTEDLYFRAWMLPKMARYGAPGWVANGVLFAAYNSFQLWLFPVLIGPTICMAYLTHKTRSIWPGLALHAALNALALAGIVALMLR